MVGSVHSFSAVVSCVGLLGLSLSAPQLRHVERLVDMIEVAPRRKTLAQLAAQECDGGDVSNLADFVRISPWDPQSPPARLARKFCAAAPAKV